MTVRLNTTSIKAIAKDQKNGLYENASLDEKIKALKKLEKDG